MTMNNELIKINTDDNGQQAVSGRELHRFLDSKERFSKWFDRMVGEYGFVEGTDYTPYQMVHPQNNQIYTDYAMTIDMAKEVSMVSKLPRGREARQYFIACEKQLKQQKPMSQLEILAGATQALLQHEQQLKALQERAEASEQKVTQIETKLNNLVELQSIDAADDNWRAATDYVINAIARQAMDGDYAAARRESYQELRKMHTDVSRIAVNKRKAMEAKNYTKTKIRAETSKIYIIEHDEKLRQKYTQVIKTMAARYQIDFAYEGSNDDDDDFILAEEEENRMNLSIAASV